MVKDSLNALKIKRSYTTAELSKLSGLDEAELRKVLYKSAADLRAEGTGKDLRDKI
jgi:hypothetical protein